MRKRKEDTKKICRKFQDRWSGRLDKVKEQYLTEEHGEKEFIKKKSPRDSVWLFFYILLQRIIQIKNTIKFLIKI